MKWQGRRQSSNVEDLRTPRSISINWETDFGDIYGIYIRTDGSIAIKNYDDNVIFLEKNFSWWPTVTTAQKETIRNILKGLYKPTVDSDDGSIKEFCNAISRYD